MALVLPLALLVMPVDVTALDSHQPDPAVQLDLLTLPMSASATRSWWPPA